MSSLVIVYRATDFQTQFLEKCGVIERALSGWRNRGLSCLWKAIEMELLHISLVNDNLDTCKEAYISVEILIDLQFIRNVIRGIIAVVYSY